MSYLFFDLNIFNYSVNELKSLIKLPEKYNNEIIDKQISSIKEKILLLKLPERENCQYFSFLNHIKVVLENELNKIEKIRLEKNINKLKIDQENLKKQLSFLRKNEKKIKKE